MTKRCDISGKNTLGAKKWHGQEKTVTKTTDIRMWPRFISQCIMGCTKTSLKLQLSLTRLIIFDELTNITRMVCLLLGHLFWFALSIVIKAGQVTSDSRGTLIFSSTDVYGDKILIGNFRSRKKISSANQQVWLSKLTVVSCVAKKNRQ